MELINNKFFQNNIKFAIFTYVIFLGICYLLGYWQSFDINIFNYIGLWDILKFSASSLVTSIIVGYIPTFIILWFGFENRDRIEKIALNPIGKFTINILLVFSIFICLLEFIIGIYALFIHFYNFNLATLKGLFALIFMIVCPILLNLILLKFNLIKNTKISFLVCVFFGSFPSIAFITGLREANYILKNLDYLYTGCDSITMDKSCKYLKYIGTVNNQLFFIDQDNKKITIKDFEKLSELTLIHFQKY